MKPVLITTGSLFGLITALHVWKVVAEWPSSGASAVFAAGMAALILLPAGLSWWAWSLLGKIRK